LRTFNLLHDKVLKNLWSYTNSSFNCMHGQCCNGSFTTKRQETKQFHTFGSNENTREILYELSFLTVKNFGFYVCQFFEIGSVFP